MRILGLDVGSRTIGMAVSDELGMTAQGLRTIERTSIDQDLAELTRIMTQYCIERIVVGLPKNMDGTFGQQAEKILRFKKKLHETTRLPVDLWDERLSTVEAHRILLEADLSRKKRKKTIDQLAAVLILQGYLDRHRERHDDLSHST